MATKPRFALYLRISKDPTGTSTAPARQEKECRALARERGIQIVEVFSDVDTSAYRDVARPEYERMLDAVAAGELDGVLVWKLDRLMRRVVEFSRFWQVASAHEVALISRSDTIDTTTPMGLAVVYLIVGLAEQESYNTSLRLKAKEREMAAAGRHKHAGRPAYGMRPGWTEAEPAEATIIREAAERLLAGESARSIIADLNDRGVPSASGGQWRARSLTTLLRQARLFGKREHHGEIVADGDWPAILDERTGLRLRALLDRGTPTGERQGRKYLLSGLLRCQKCGARMTGTTTKRLGRKYLCPKTNGGCGATTVQMEAADDAVSDMALYRLDSPALRRSLKARAKGARSDDSAILVELGDLARRQDELAEIWASGELSRTSWLSAQQKLDERTEDLTRQLADVQHAAPAELLEGAGGRPRWERMSIDRRRAVLDAVLDRVVVHGAGSDWYAGRLREALLDEADEAEATGDMVLAKRRRKQAQSRTAGGGSFRPERLEPVWRI
jgi:site-specific DNA recombinase